MDSTPNPNPNPNPNQPSSTSIKTCATKLPIKRKNPNHSSFNPNFPASSNIVPKTEFPNDDSGDRKLPPFKFHRIWTEPDEIRFLQGLLDCASQGLSFPRDLHKFFARFSETMSQPYTRSQLSEKLRRLRKKFRVISARLARGLDQSLLSPHDRSLFDLSKQLWHPKFSSGSPFNSNSKDEKPILVGVKVSFSPTLSLSSQQDQVGSFNGASISYIDDDQADDVDEEDGIGDMNVEEVNVDSIAGKQEEKLVHLTNSGNGIGLIGAKTVIDVLDQTLKEAQRDLIRQDLHCPDRKAALAVFDKGKTSDYEKRWREQRFLEFDVLARRLRLILERSLCSQ